MTTDTHATPTAADIRDQREHVEQYRRLLAEAERELARMLAAAGRRPGDGSDQPNIFDPGPAVGETPDLFATTTEG
jgi:hypothetical protein